MNNSTPEVNAVKLRLINPTIINGSTNVVPKGATMKGDLQSAVDLSIRIEGEYSGKIIMQTGGSIHVSANAKVNCEEMVADFIFIEGEVKGDVHARKAIELSSTAKVKGSCRYDKDLDFHPGARITGQMTGPDED